MSLIETYHIKKEGYNPFLIREGWQVAQLNYTDEQHIENIDKIEIHNKTDEVFVLLKGQVVLIGAKFENETPVFEAILLKFGITYNIPKNIWHNIAMEKGAEVLIVEKSNTHESDFDYFYLNDGQIADLRDNVNTDFKQNKNIKL